MSSDTPSENMENDRKQRLYALKQERMDATQSATADAGTGDAGQDKDKTEGDVINKFLKDIVTRKKERKKQLEIIHDFFENPAAYGVDTDLIPSSTTTMEVDERKKDLKHKIDLLRSVLKALEGEMQMLEQMKQPDEAGDPATAESLAGDPESESGKPVAKKKAAPKKKALKNKSRE